MQHSRSKHIALLTALIGTSLITGCSSTPPMQDTSTYAQMNCAQLQQEKEVVAKHTAAADDASSFGFTNLLGSIAEGASIINGDTATAQTQHAANADYLDYQEKRAGDAQAYSNRVDLLDKIIEKRNCNQL